MGSTCRVEVNMSLSWNERICSRDGKNKKGEWGWWRVSWGTMSRWRTNGREVREKKKARRRLRGVEQWATLRPIILNYLMMIYQFHGLYSYINEHNVCIVVNYKLRDMGEWSCYNDMNWKFNDWLNVALKEISVTKGRQLVSECERGTAGIHITCVTAERFV